MDAASFETWLGAIATLTRAQRQQALEALMPLRGNRCTAPTWHFQP